MENKEVWGLYARVSDPRQAAEGVSVDAQARALVEWAEGKHYDFRLYSDRGKSAWVEDIAKRPEFQRMLEDVRAGVLQGVAVSHIDRFSRKLIVTLTVLGEFGQKAVGFVSLENAAFDFSRPADRLLLAVLRAFAQYYSDELSRKVRRGLAERASQGMDVGSLEFGYCNTRCIDCKNANPPCPRWGTLSKDAPAILHPIDAAGVVLAFQSYREGNKSFDDVATILNQAGYRSRTPHGRVLWNKHSVDELLSNLSYTGVVAFKGQEIPGKHPAIISRELFDEVQAIRHKRNGRGRQFNRKYRVYLFGGLLKCSGCGRVMRAQTKGPYDRKCYRCTSRELRHVKCDKKTNWVNEDVLAQRFEGIVRQFKLPENWQARLKELVNGNGKRKNVEGERRSLTDRLNRIKHQHEWGDLSDGDYLKKRREIQAALAELKAPEVSAIIDAGDYLQNMAKVWKEATDEDRRDMTRAILEEVICDPELRRLVALRPKPSFVLLFRQIPGLIQRDGLFEIPDLV